MKKINNIELGKKDVNKTFTLHGFVDRRRDMGGVIFVDLRDRSGIMQVVFDRKYLKDNFNLAESIKNEYNIKVSGKLSLRNEEEINKNLKTGEVELMVDELKILNESKPLPFNIYSDEEINENVALKYRYLDLRRNKLQNIIMTRHKITKSVREYFDNLDFLEIETPILSKSTPEGARDYIVPSRINKGSFYALPQSPQIYKQLLMVSGFEKYYQIAKSFRDEDLRADRQPEFTQIDLEVAYADEEVILDIIEGLLKKVWKDILNIELETFERMTYAEAMENYGTDKPDTRFDLKLKDLTEILEDTKMNVFRNAIKDGGIAKAIVVRDSKYPRNEIDKLIEFAKEHGARGLAWLKFEDKEFIGVIAKNLEKEKQDLIKESLDIKEKDLVLIVSGSPKTVYQSLGALRLKIAKDFNMIDEDKYNFVWVTDFPMFEYSEEEKRYVSSHHPFTMPQDLKDLDSPETAISRAYDAVCNGYELGSGSVRIHDPKLQFKVFEKLGITKENAEKRFGFFLESFEYGAPPHAGIALGLDRIVMLIAKTNNIKDVIAFPKTQSASDLMNGAPDNVDTEQLDELGIIIKEKKDE